MEVEVLSLKLRGDSLPAHAEYTRNYTERSWELGRNQTTVMS